ncbi:MAG: hypothetical protein H0X29_03555 [Parachlamydiaceae bacterium]|nr:hypothetical protein [Parachlamydiaceae bacterium]
MTVIENKPQATIFNQIENDQAYKTTYPSMVGQGANVEAAQELHIFLAELNPSEERVKEYYDVVQKWNDQHLNLSYSMKPCYLGLVFRDASGAEQTVSVMQSSRYVHSNNTDYVVQQSHEDAQWFIEHGFSVIREKIEAQIHGIDGIPNTNAEMALFPTKYFEFHIKIGRVDKEDSSELSEEEIEQLKTISNDFTRKFRVPIPLSYNRNKNQSNGDGQGNQRFLNVRFRQIGFNQVALKVEEIKEAIKQTGKFKVLKTISEYVWYDSFSQLDHGWIDYTPEELKGMMDNL